MRSNSAEDISTRRSRPLRVMVTGSVNALSLSAPYCLRKFADETRNAQGSERFELFELWERALRVSSEGDPPGP